jgi:hypothetical protein
MGGAKGLHIWLSAYEDLVSFRHRIRHGIPAGYHYRIACALQERGLDGNALEWH